MKLLLLAAVLVVAPSAFAGPTGPGNHASVQSGQVRSDDTQEVIPNDSGFNQQWAGQRSMTGEGQLCAGCLDYQRGEEGRSTHFQQQNYQTGNPQPGFAGPQVRRSEDPSNPSFDYSVQLTQPPQIPMQQPLPQGVPQSRWNQGSEMPDLGPNTVQHLQMNDQGQYSFSYSAADSSRQERRNLDGTVEGSYAFTDPEGHQVSVEYRAAPNEGYQVINNNVGGASGAETKPKQYGGYQGQVESSFPAPGGVPVQVQDTPEVQAARAQFFQAYQEQVDRIEQETKARALLLQQQRKEAADKIVSIYSENMPSKDKLASASDFKNLPEPIAVPDATNLGHAEVEEDDELDNEAVVVSADDDVGSVPASVGQGPAALNGKRQNPLAQAVPIPLANQGAAYQLSHTVGGQTGRPVLNGGGGAYHFSQVLGSNQGYQGPMGQGVTQLGANQGYQGAMGQGVAQLGANQGYQGAMGQVTPFGVGQAGPSNNGAYQFSQNIGGVQTQPIPHGQAQVPSQVIATQGNGGAYQFNQNVGEAQPLPQGQVSAPGQGSAFQLSHMVGVSSVSGGQGQGANAWAVPVGQNTNQGQMGQFQGQPGTGIPLPMPTGLGQTDAKLRGGMADYFYFVSVGGNPHYVTSSNLLRSDFPTSLKATLVGALPIAAVHDTQQTPHQQVGGAAQAKASPPLYVDYNTGDSSKTVTTNSGAHPLVFGFIPGTFVNLGGNGQVQQGQQQQRPFAMPNNSNAANGYNSNVDGNKNQQQQHNSFVAYPFALSFTKK